MARTEGRLRTSIWSNADFLALDAEPQRLYMFLLSQPDLSHAGLVPLRARRWAAKVSGGTAASITAALAILTAARFVVVDEDTEEVLIRTFVRNDGVYKQPKVMLRMREDATQIESPLLRAAFLVELDRLPLDELSDAPGGPRGDQPSTRQTVMAVVDALRGDFAIPTGGVSVGVSDTHPEGDAVPPRVHAGAFPHPPTPVPLPLTPTLPMSEAAPSDTSSPAAPSRSTEPAGFADFWEQYPRKVGKDDARKAYTSALRRASVTQIVEGATRYATDPNLVEKQFIPHPATWLNGGRWDDEPLPPRSAGHATDRQADILRAEMEHAQAADAEHLEIGA